MSEKTRGKKDGERKDKKNQRMDNKTPDPRQNADRPNVKDHGPDQHDQDLKAGKDKEK